MSDLERFIAEAKEFVGGRFSRRSDDFNWGEGSDVIPFFEGVVDDDTAIAQAQEWARMRYDAGFGWVSGPKEFGGRELPLPFDLAYRVVESEYEVPDTSHLDLGWGMVGPTVLRWAPEQLKEQILRPLYRGDLVACQLFSEPEAGSDLASVRTGAVRDGDGWRIQGQKVWTSDAHHSQIGLLLARTSSGDVKHAGLTMFLVDMDSPGIEVRPLLQMSGGAHFNEVFFDDVFVPDDRRLGEVDGGWKVALTTLMNERGSVGSGPPATMAAVSTARLVALARHLDRASDPMVRQQIAQIHTSLAVARTLDELGRARILGGADPGPEGSLLKLMFSKNLTAAAVLAASLWGHRGIADTGEWGAFAWTDFMLATPALRILGGTEEIMKNILAERVLGLPKG